MPAAVTRFAPSPTGRLHVGNIRTALHNWLFARKHGGRFILRLDDTDRERSREEYAEAIREDLDWLGLDWDEEDRQSARFVRYEAALERLREEGRAYPAYETAQELDLKRKVLLGRGKPPVYDRAALALSDADRASLEAEGRRPHWRFKLDHAAGIEWDDLIRGRQHFDPALLSDPVIRREDGSWLYMLPSVVDDIEMGVTHVVRGEDHVTNTGLQLQMFAALGAPAPAFAHEALLVGSEGKLAKRLGSLGVEAMREAGIEPLTLLAKLARIGTSLPVEAVRGRCAADRELRLRHVRPRPRPLRHGRARIAQRANRSPACIRCSEEPAAGRHGRSGLGGDSPQSRPRRRGRRLVGDPARPCRGGGARRGSRIPGPGGRDGGRDRLGRIALAATHRST